MLRLPKGPVFHCRQKKEGHGFKQECLNPNFLVYPDGRIVCSLCGHIYENFEELKTINESDEESGNLPFSFKKEK